MLPVTQVWKLEVLSVIIKDSHSPEVLLASTRDNLQLTIECTGARLLGARHASLNNYCFPKATVMTYPIENWGEISLLNPCRALMHLDVLMPGVHHCSPVSGAQCFTWWTESTCKWQWLQPYPENLMKVGSQVSLGWNWAGHPPQVLYTGPRASYWPEFGSSLPVSRLRS